MKVETSLAPVEIQALCERCVAHVQQRFGLELDYTADTLSVLDYFIQAVIAEEAAGEELPAGDQRRAHLVHLLAPTLGAYFGEVLRREFPCRWRIVGDDPTKWAVDFEFIILRASPIGAVAEALFGAPVAGWGAELVAAPAFMELLAERLAVAPPVPEDEFFALTTRFEVLQISEEFLRLTLARSQGTEEPLPWLSPEDYDAVLG
ncbi:MAG: hypothetical protein MUC50_16470 [Myxococcota bacterium]|jgi:hypothetical protein|nr:hypothetical protein [Myxococcota bacterium]